MIKAAHKKEIIAVLCAFSRSRKTIFCEEYLKEPPHNTIDLCSGLQMKTGFLALAKALRLFAKKKILELRERMVKKLKRKAVVVEYYLIDSVLEYIRPPLFQGTDHNGYGGSKEPGWPLGKTQVPQSG